MTARFGDLTAQAHDLAHLVTIRAVKVDGELMSLLQALVLRDGELLLFAGAAPQQNLISGFDQIKSVAAGEATIRVLVRNASA
jgi:hypothetical protein